MFPAERADYAERENTSAGFCEFCGKYFSNFPTVENKSDNYIRTAMEKITSVQNPKIKNLKRLEKASERREQNLFLIEGLRETVLAQRAGYEIESLFVCEEILKSPQRVATQKVQSPVALSSLTGQQSTSTGRLRDGLSRETPDCQVRISPNCTS